MLLAMKSSTGAEADVIAAPSAGRLRIWKLTWSMDGTGTLTIHAGTAGATADLVHVDAVAGSSDVLDFESMGGFALPATTALKVTTSAQTAKVVAYYTVNPT